MQRSRSTAFNSAAGHKNSRAPAISPTRFEALKVDEAIISHGEAAATYDCAFC